jgi:hypothetical protein
MFTICSDTLTGRLTVNRYFLQFTRPEIEELLLAFGQLVDLGAELTQEQRDLVPLLASALSAADKAEKAAKAVA